MALFPAPAAVSPYPDFLEFVWTSWRLDKVLLGVEPLYSTQLIFAPSGSSLLLHTVSEGILLPMSILLPHMSPVWRVNGTFILLIVLNTLSIFSLMIGRKVTFILALLFSFLVGLSPFVMGHIHAGHVNFLILFPLVEVIHGLHELLFGGLRKIPKLMIARYLCAVLLLPFTNLYYLYFFGLVGSFYSLTYLWIWVADNSQSQPRYRLALQSVRSALVRPTMALLLTLVAFAPAIPHVFDIAVLAFSRTYTPDHNPGVHAATLIDFMSPSRLQMLSSIWTSLFSLPTPRLHVGESALYVPYGMIFLGTFFLIFRNEYTTGNRKHLILGLLFIVVSFGPRANLFHTLSVPNPVDWIFRATLPFFPSVPARFGGIGALFLTLFVAGCTVQATKREVRYFILPLLVLAIVEIFPYRISPHHLQSFSELKEVIKGRSEREVIVDLSIPAQDAMYRQTIHEMPIVGGFISRRPKKIERTIRRNVFARFLRGEILPSNEVLANSWCELKGDILLLPISVSNSEIGERLKEIGFSEVGHADGFEVLKRTGFTCPKNCPPPFLTISSETFE